MALIIRESPIQPHPSSSSNCSPHRLDLLFWYSSGFGSPVGRAQGIGYVQELVARLTKTPIQTVCRDCPLLTLADHALAKHNSTTNSTMDDNPITFPLDGRSLYVDATHESLVINGIRLPFHIVTP